MTIEKAIEILSASANAGVTTLNQDFKDAQNLGIEALIRIDYLRSQGRIQEDYALPGETPTFTNP